MKGGTVCRCGDITYTLYRRDIKNMYLRIDHDGSVTVSAGKRFTDKMINDFILKNYQKIAAQKARLSNVKSGFAADPNCRETFERISLKIYPHFKAFLPDGPPEIKIRAMKSAWGVCHIKKKYITLNSLLANYPREAAEYVILHEYAHFVHPNHQKAFYELIQRLMPDYRQRRAILRRK